MLVSHPGTCRFTRSMWPKFTEIFAHSDSIKSTEWTERSHGSVHMHQDPIRSKLQNFSGPHPIPTPRKSFSCMNMVQEKLKSENKSLQANLSRVMERMDTMRTENEDLRNNLDKANAQVVTTICSFERQELDYRGKIARLEEQVRQMQLEYTDPEMSKRGKQLPIVKRFVDTLGRIRELETVSELAHGVATIILLCSYLSLHCLFCMA